MVLVQQSYGRLPVTQEGLCVRQSTVGTKPSKDSATAPRTTVVEAMKSVEIIILVIELGRTVKLRSQLYNHRVT